MPSKLSTSHVNDIIGLLCKKETQVEKCRYVLGKMFVVCWKRICKDGIKTYVALYYVHKHTMKPIIL